MNSDLKPCPFCGGDADFQYHNGGWPDACYSVRCKDWKCPGKTSSGSQAVAAEAWNTRADTDALTAAQEENERLVHDIEKLSASLSAEVSGSEKLRKAIEALGAMPEGYCFCSRYRIGDDSKIHEPECADLRAALGGLPR